MTDSQYNLSVWQPSTIAVFQRTKTTLGILREVVQESLAEYWFEKGIAARIASNTEEAIRAFSHCLELDPNHWKGTLHLSVLSIKKSEQTELLDAEFLQVLCRYFYDEKATLWALEKLNGLVVAWPDNLDYYNERGLLNGKALANYQASIRDFDIISELVNFSTFHHPAIVERYKWKARFNRGCVKYQSGDYAGAIQDFDELIQAHGHSCYAYHNRAVAKDKTGDINGASADNLLVQEHFDGYWTSFDDYEGDIYWMLTLL